MSSRTKQFEYSRIKNRYFHTRNGDIDDSEEDDSREERRIHYLKKLDVTYDNDSILRLPALASEFFEDNFSSFGTWNVELRELFIGTRDKGSNLSTLRGFEGTILRHIYSFLAHEWAKYVTRTLPAGCIGRLRNNEICRFSGTPDYEVLEDLSAVFEKEGKAPNWVAFASCGHIKFPDPADRNINMMPFIFGDESSLPKDLQCYFECIQACPYTNKEIGMVGYLTVHESHVDPNAAQRREGLHIETPGNFVKGDGSTFTPAREHHWGNGNFYGPDVYQGGIFMASTVADTSEVFDALVNKNAVKTGIVDNHGSCEHLRNILGPGTKLETNELIWMTDRTPHEALPQTCPGYRQFFRVVTSKVSHWFSQHSTPNPLVGLPDHVVVIDENKFE